MSGGTFGVLSRCAERALSRGARESEGEGKINQNIN